VANASNLNVLVLVYVRHLHRVNHKLTVSVKTVINTTDYLLQLARLIIWSRDMDSDK